MKKIYFIFAILIFNFLSAPIFAQNKTKSSASAPKFTLIDESNIFRLRPLTESLIIGSSVALLGTEHSLKYFAKFNLFDYKTGGYGAEASRDYIPTMDLIFMQPYSNVLNHVSWGSLALTALTPALFGFTEEKSQWLTLSVMYAETLLLATSFKDLSKTFVVRARPYMYYDLSGAPQNKLENYDWENSFFSGHTTWAFAAATFTSYVFCQNHPDTKWRYAVIGGTYALASLTGILRISAGCHFLSDVICGAIAGSITGFLVPYFHTAKFWKKSKNVEFSLVPNGFYLTARL